MMKRADHLKQVKNRLQNARDGTIFVPSDFFDIAEAVKTNKCLNRLVETGELQRVIRGIYVKPRYSALLDRNIPPRTDDIAKAIARNYGWTIVPCGDTALNMLGLSTQVPAVWLYISDGPYKTYEADGIRLKFKHTDSKNEIINISYKAALVIQALKALGQGNVTDKDIFGISKLLTNTEKTQLLSETMRVTAWVYDLIRKICMESEHE
ncbi:MAG: DUF6088 family protein [Saccharofermentanales bacterium]